MPLETETIDKLFLELSQFTRAKTEREISLSHALQRIVILLRVEGSEEGARQSLQIAEGALRESYASGQ